MLAAVYWQRPTMGRMLDPQLQASVLNQALPYIQAFRGHTFVIKYGGSAMVDPARLNGVIRNVLLMQLVGIRPIVVHGGGPEIDYWLEKLGMEKLQKNGQRVTDDATMDVVEMALAGRSNKALVAEVQRAGGRAIGLSGRDSDLLAAERSDEELGRVGRVTRVNDEILRLLSEAGYIPVICSVGTDADHRAINVNADLAASSIASAVRATKLILLTDTDGVLKDRNDPASVISEISPMKARMMVDSGEADRGMIPKLQAAIAAVESGVKSVHLINGGRENALLIEVFTDLGIGTMMQAQG
jgi:acetylglutamate kinase